MQPENVNEAPVNQWASSIFWLIPLALVFGVLLVVGTFALINWSLPSDDAAMLKQLFAVTIGGSTGGAALTGAIGFVKRSLKLTDAKLSNVQSAELPEVVRDPSVIDHSFDGFNPGIVGYATNDPFAPVDDDSVFVDSIPAGRPKDSE